MKYNILRGYAWYNVVVTWPMRYRLYVTFLLLSMTTSIWFFLLYKPVSRSIQAYCKKNVVLKGKMRELAKAQERNVQLSKAITGYRRDFDGYRSNFMDPHEFIALIANEAVGLNLYLNTCQLEPVQSSGWCNIYSMRIDVQGSWSAVLQWLQVITKKTPLVSMPSIAVAHTGQGIVRCSTTIDYMRLLNKPL